MAHRATRTAGSETLGRSAARLPLKTKRWNEPVEPDDGLRVLVCRFRPRGVRKEDETWDLWAKNLGPSRELLAAFQGKSGPPLPWKDFARQYRAEMKAERDLIRSLAERLRLGERMTLLCSSSCVDPGRCHRTLLAGLLEHDAAARA
ncbi:DUF488 domain-containing protein [Polyangium mundeleinium]|uniref:DUF488 family protein n=1 Tax=Polyangium mundeleinium TaxID=2995306 RepID=A0ABT5EUX1_9BACT|nr:DUF488 family protein [Polyangium mundeleinium]MDC0744580.1 DUF488 family protein [Polyangium mundeleinium]